ncbi:MAG: hypothetical protein AAED33_03320 [Paracoccaceae bacterium]
MNAITAQLRTKETWDFLMKLIFCSVFYVGIVEQLGINFSFTPLIVLGSLAVYWKLVRQRFLP